MKLHPQPSSSSAAKRLPLSRRASAIVTVMIFIVILSILVGSIVQWNGSHGKIVNRYNEFIRAQYAAEAGVEKTYSAIRNFVRINGRAPSQNDLDNMGAAAFVPTTADNGSFSAYAYISPTGSQTGTVSTRILGPSAFQQITAGPYSGLYGLVLPYSIHARAQTIGRPETLTAGIRRDLEYQSIPIFQFAVFYNVDLEIENGPPMTISGRLHSNGNGYFAPDTSLTFADNVTIAKKYFANPIPGDTHKSSWNSPNFSGSSTVTAGVPSLNLPLYSTSGTTSAHDILEMPPSSGTDTIAGDRMYTKANLRIRVINGGTVIAMNNSGATVTLPATVISTNKTLFNFRENKTVNITEINVGQLSSSGNFPSNGIVYVIDQRNSAGIVQTAVRLVNGSNLPNQGLTVATPNPIYIQGNYNNGATTKPSAIMADAINILSNNWNDANSGAALSARIATATTVNAAFYSGIVLTDTVNNRYSGGLENFPRFLENWSNVVFTYKGSMVSMFPSETATGIWANSSYSPPNRNWSFDNNFLDPTLLPPGTPSVITLVRSTWSVAP